MSAIFGIIDLKGRTIEKEWITSMQNDLAHRGPDGEGLYEEQGIVLGHKLLQVTPESIYDRSPYEEDGFVITANARLDERASIMDRLDIPADEREVITDPLLLLRSFRKFGKDFVKDIYGDFAFAIWDIQKKELFCARDHTGVKPFLYYFKDERLVFSTELKALVNLPCVQTEIDSILLRNEAIGLYDKPDQTAWKNIVRLHAAHHLSINDQDLVIERYWDLVAKEDLTLKTEEDSALKLRELLKRVIDDHTRVIGEVGVPLSGGLDSSTIACIAARKFALENKIVHSVSSVLDPKEDDGEFRDEKEYIDEVLKQEPNISAEYVYHTEMEFLKEIESKFEKQYAPVVHSHFVDDALNAKLHIKGVNRVLSGTLGDMTTSNSTLRPLPLLFAQGKFFKFFSLSRKYRKRMDLSIVSHIRQNILQPIAPSFIYELRQGIIGKKTPWDISELPFNDAGQVSSDLKKRLKSYYRDNYLNPFNTINKIWATKSENHGEEWDCGPSHLHLEYTYPLLDRRILEFLVTVPIAHFYADGYKRGLIRKAMSGILPEKIRLRTNKMPYAPADEQIYNRDLPIVIELMTQMKTSFRENNSNIDEEKIKKMIDYILISKKKRIFVPNYWIVIDLSVWIKFIYWIKDKNYENKNKENVECSKN
jgi:asparagine synthase (glutamine-hydrolysing)